MAGQPERRVIVIKHNRYARPEACSICDADRNLSIGPGLFEEGSWQGVCDACGREHAPGLLAMLQCPEVQRAYWEAEEAGAQERQRTELAVTLASLEADLAALQGRLEATRKRLDDEGEPRVRGTATADGGKHGLTS